MGSGVLGAGGIKNSTKNASLNSTTNNIVAGDFTENGLWFKGVNQYTSLGVQSILLRPGAISIEALAKAPLADYGTFVQLGKPAGQGWGLTIGVSGITPAQKLAFTFYNGAWRSVSDPDVFPVNTKFHAGATYNGDTLKIFTNGIQKASTSYVGSFDYASAAGFFIGAYFTTPSMATYLNGIVYEVRISSTPRPPE